MALRNNLSPLRVEMALKCPALFMSWRPVRFVLKINDCIVYLFLMENV